MKININLVIVLGIMIVIAFMLPNIIDIIKPNNETKVDTIYVTKTITIPAKEGEFNNPNPKPKKIYITDTAKYNALVLEYRTLQTENEKLLKYKDAIKLRFYEEHYLSDDESVLVSVADSVRGNLEHQNVKFYISPQEITYTDKIVVKKLKPAFTLSAGITYAPGIINVDAVGSGLIGIKNSTGTELMVGYNTNKQYVFGVKQDIFSIYKNK